MPRPKKEVATDRAPPSAAAASGASPATERPVPSWLPQPRKRPILLGILATVYLIWLLALVWLASGAASRG